LDFADDDSLIDVVEVDASLPMDTYKTSGKVIVPLTAVGRTFYISSVHCKRGMKVDIKVLSRPIPKPKLEEEPKENPHHAKFLKAAAIFVSAIVGAGFIIFLISSENPIPPLTFFGCTWNVCGGRRDDPTDPIDPIALVIIKFYVVLRKLSKLSRLLNRRVDRAI
ncbi:hypothetical protein MKW92_033336, partial [Papaver armeniacum]